MTNAIIIKPIGYQSRMMYIQRILTSYIQFLSIVQTNLPVFRN